jgi:hypothetical protein
MVMLAFDCITMLDAGLPASAEPQKLIYFATKETTFRDPVTQNNFGGCLSRFRGLSFIISAETDSFVFRFVLL